MMRTIGGLFGLEPLWRFSLSTSSTAIRPQLEMVNARSALAELLRCMAVKRVWLPAYVCPVIVPNRADNVTVEFYSPGFGLRCTDTRWTSEVQSGELVVVIDYFGFNPPEELLQTLVERDAILVRDCCQNFFCDLDTLRGHYTLLSPRKFLGVPDGGILVALGDSALPNTLLSPVPQDWFCQALAACVGRLAADESGIPNTWFAIGQHAEREMPKGAFSMCDTTRAILSALEPSYVDSIKTRRRENYATLAADLSDIAIFPTLTAASVPLAFPIVVKNRDTVRSRLFERGFFPPTHWELGNCVPDMYTDCHSLASMQLSLPCDQRYSGEEMRAMAGIVKMHVQS